MYNNPTMLHIFLLAIVGTVIAIAIGSFWYSPATPMGRLHMKAMGFDKLSPEEQKKKMEEAKPHMMNMYLTQMLFSFITAFAVVFIVTESMRNGLPLSAALGFVAVNWFCFVVPTIGSGTLWSTTCESQVAWKKFASEIASNLVTMLLTGLVAGVLA